MGIFDRMGKVISSNINSLLDKAEDDKKLVELNLDEMDEQLKAGHQEVVAAVAAEKQLRKKADDLRGEKDKWEKRAELALKADDEPLAREALKQKKRVETEATLVEKSRAEQAAAAVKMKDELERMKERLAELKMKKGTIVTRAQQARAGTGELGARPGGSAFENFRQLEQRIEGREAESAAMAEVEDALGTKQTQDLESKFRELEKGQGKSGSGGSEIDAELEALKKRIRV